MTLYVLLTAEKASLSYKVEQIDLLLNISFLFFMTVNSYKNFVSILQSGLREASR